MNRNKKINSSTFTGDLYEFFEGDLVKARPPDGVVDRHKRQLIGQIFRVVKAHDHLWSFPENHWIECKRLDNDETISFYRKYLNPWNGLDAALEMLQSPSDAPVESLGEQENRS